MATINRNIEQVRKTANQMRADNVTLEDGQLGYESDTRRGKVGPGAYNSLPYKDDLNIAEADVDYAADQRDGGATGGVVTQEYVDNADNAIVTTLLYADTFKADAVPTYKALVSQAGTDAPTAVVLINTLGLGSWTYFDEGDYRLVGAGKFPKGRTLAWINPTVTGISIDAQNVADTVKINNATSGDGTMSSVEICIEVYPAP